jgi:predicted dehydrogenase
MTREEIRIGIIGVGQIGKQHIAAYQKIPAARVVALCDSNAQELARVAAGAGVRTIETDFRALLAREEIDAVDVCLHNNLHMPVTVAALQAGKHVYCEKPMAGSYRDAQIMLETARITGRKLSIQLSTLYSPPETKAASALIRDGRLGRIYHARSIGFRRRGRPYVDGYGSSSFVQKPISAGGAMYDVGVYHLAQILHLLSNPAVERVSGKTYQEIGMDEKRRAAGGYDVEELGLGFVRLSGNMSLDIVEAWALMLDGMEGSVVLGSEGGVRLQPFGYFHAAGDLDLDSTADLEKFMLRQHTVQGIGDEYDGAQNHLVAALQGRVELLPTADLALAAMLISEGIYLSEKLGREVTAEEVRNASVSSAAALEAAGSRMQDTEDRANVTGYRDRGVL